MKTKTEKTNAMRRLDALKIKYKEHTYTDTDAVSGVEVAEVLNQEPGRVFKTLVTQGKSKNYYVFMIPVAEELDLKKAAKAVGEKSIEMIKSKELLPLTGYIHGGCSTLVRKKNFFTTTTQNPAADYETIFFSGGRIGFQIELAFSDLQKAIKIQTADIISSDILPE